MMGTEQSPGFSLDALRDRLAYQPLLLGGVALVAGTALTLASNATRAPIAAAEAHDTQMTLAQVLPAGSTDNDLLKDVLELPGPAAGSARRIHIARKAGVVTGAVFNVSERGYAGEIRLLMAVDPAGRVLGVRVLKHTETPGLGDKIEIARNPWITSFNGHSLGDPAAEQWAVRKDGGIYDSFAGATITPRAVVKAVKGGLDYFAAHRNEILGAQP
ncbi:electron transport complex subunit RsxG [Aromatoleum evansii]|uniref:Ion-translocating oxidoreductase complex subunit G n=1 Tax=Aromatoleum evansii TaxID=59406 RepID=A0ABZ1AMU6_AROEV|nr:electron transport complex subunit RsxG [Aromatoleum evansii]